MLSECAARILHQNLGRPTLAIEIVNVPVPLINQVTGSAGSQNKLSW